jgi:serine/threonine-protein kinase
MTIRLLPLPVEVVILFSPSNAKVSFMSGVRFGRYEVVRELGRGGMATVYLARDPRLESEVAVKVLPAQFSHDPSFRSRFEREAKAIARLRRHPAIVPVYDFGTEREQPFLVMDYLSGGSLADRLRLGPISLSEAAAIMDRVSGALDYAHKLGIIHRDVKPGNILFDEAGLAYLSDFGIAKLTQQTATLPTQGIIGTPAYMSPEQVDGREAIDARSDIYALGIVLFEMLTGEQPYQADTPAQQMMAHVIQPVPHLRDLQPTASPAVDNVIKTALAKDKTQRYQTSVAFTQAFSKAILEKDDSLLFEAAAETTLILDQDPIDVQSEEASADSLPPNNLSVELDASTSIAETDWTEDLNLAEQKASGKLAVEEEVSDTLTGDADRDSMRIDFGTQQKDSVAKPRSKMVTCLWIVLALFVALIGFSCMMITLSLIVSSL